MNTRILILTFAIPSTLLLMTQLMRYPVLLLCVRHLLTPHYSPHHSPHNSPLCPLSPQHSVACPVVTKEVGGGGGVRIFSSSNK